MAARGRPRSSLEADGSGPIMRKAEIPLNGGNLGQGGRNIASVGLRQALPSSVDIRGMRGQKMEYGKL